MDLAEAIDRRVTPSRGIQKARELRGRWAAVTWKMLDEILEGSGMDMDQRGC